MFASHQKERWGRRSTRGKGFRLGGDSMEGIQTGIEKQVKRREKTNKSRATRSLGGFKPPLDFFRINIAINFIKGQVPGVHQRSAWPQVTHDSLFLAPIWDGCSFCDRWICVNYNDEITINYEIGPIGMWCRRPDPPLLDQIKGWSLPPSNKSHPLTSAIIIPEARKRNRSNQRWYP